MTTCPRCGEPERSRTDDSVTYLCGSYQFDGYHICHSDQCDKTCLVAVESQLRRELVETEAEVARLLRRAESAELLIDSAAHLFQATRKPADLSPHWTATRDRWLSTAQGMYDNLS